jgi:superfamily II DNA or RNA helicase
MSYSPGSLVKSRGREWVVQPSENSNLLILKPLGGSEEETTGIYLPLQLPEDRVESAEFPFPSPRDIGDISTAKILYDAARLSFRSGAGPFRALAKLSFRPRAYQMVPLIMALKQEIVRLFIADDVGVGKTIEALLIVKELLERREIKRFAVVCLPHLCEQWQQELKDKFDIDAVIIRSNTQARLDREIHEDTSVYEYYPYQVISVDYIKSDNRRQVFIHQCPELIVVDEAHTCARPSGASKSQQQRYHLLHDLAKKDSQHLILLTATPHSGKAEEFQSLLGLINPRFETIDLPNASQAERVEIAKHLIQRKRADVQNWMGQETIFPDREPGEFDYELAPKYREFFSKALDFAQSLTQRDEESGTRKRVHYWTALGLLRGVMSSPAAGIMMLKNRIKNVVPEEVALLDENNPILDSDYLSDEDGESDFVPDNVVTKAEWSQPQVKKMNDLADQLGSMMNLQDDRKAAWTLEIISDWLNDGYNPVIFCRYIPTAKYLGELLKPLLEASYKQIDIQIITSEEPDEVRKQRIEAMGKTKKRVLFATDCLSEGINLQDYFTAVLHYDLPWNPNRLEQREGRVDRFGQKSPKVKAYLLYGKDNPIDGTVLKVILRKVREIKKSIGISIPFPEDSKSIMDTVLHAVLLNPHRVKEKLQLELDFGETDPIRQGEIKATNAYEKAADREKISRSIFAQHSIKAQEIEQDLVEADESIGNPDVVERFVSLACEVLGIQLNRDKKGYQLYTANIPELLKTALPVAEKIPVSFHSPSPEGYYYLGRNHLFVEQLCQYLMADALSDYTTKQIARAAVIKTAEVDIKTTIFLFRVRNVIEEKSGNNQIVAEEMQLWGYRGSTEEGSFLTAAECRKLLDDTRPVMDMTIQAQQSWLENELTNIPELQISFDKVAEERSKKLVDAHERFRKVLGGSRFKVVYPVLPVDILGIYVLLPDS